MQTASASSAERLLRRRQQRHARVHSRTCRANPARPQKGLAWVDRAGNATPLPVPPDDYTMARISPDGMRIALVVGSALPRERSAAGHLRLRSEDREPHPAYVQSSPDDGPVWSRDGSRIFYRTYVERRAGAARPGGRRYARALARSEVRESVAVVDFADGESCCSSTRSSLTESISRRSMSRKGETSSRCSTSTELTSDPSAVSERPVASPRGHQLANPGGAGPTYRGNQSAPVSGRDTVSGATFRAGGSAASAAGGVGGLRLRRRRSVLGGRPVLPVSVGVSRSCSAVNTGRVRRPRWRVQRQSLGRTRRTIGS